MPLLWMFKYAQDCSCHSSGQGFPHLPLLWQLCLAKFEFQLIATAAVSMAELLSRIYREQGITWQNEKRKNKRQISGGGWLCSGAVSVTSIPNKYKQKNFQEKCLYQQLQNNFLLLSPALFVGLEILKRQNSLPLHIPSILMNFWKLIKWRWDLAAVDVADHFEQGTRWFYFSILSWTN